MSRPLQRQINRLASKSVRLGVTGFARAGKTVFLCSVAQALLTATAWKSQRGHGALAGFGPFEREALRSVSIRDDIDPTLSQFPFREVRDCLLGQAAKWPDPTEGISQLVLDVEFEPKGFLRSVKRNHLLIYLVDYPGEWLMDLPMMAQSYSEWCEAMWKMAERGSRAALSQSFRDRVLSFADSQVPDEDDVSRMSELWSKYLKDAAERGLLVNQPGRMLRPDNFKGSAVLRFFPVPPGSENQELRKRLETRFKEYKSKIIKPFFEDHFARIDRQIVLLDVLRAIELGEEAFGEFEDALEQTLRVFNYSKGGVLDWLARRHTTKVLFAATKADHVVRGDRINLENLLRETLGRIAYNLPSEVIEHDVRALASVRATEDYMTTRPPKREILFGKPAGQATAGHWDPGGLPLDIPPNWKAVNFEFLRFAPPVTGSSSRKGFPAINIGKALEFLVGDKIA